MDQSRILRAEEATLNAWPAPSQILLDGWLLRFADGHTKRANSVNPLRPGAGADLAAKVATCERLFARNGIEPCFRLSPFAEADLPAALDDAGYDDAEDETCVVWRSLEADDLPAYDAELTEGPAGPEWLDAKDRLQGDTAADAAGRRRILASAVLPGAFAGVRGEDGGLASLAYGAVNDRTLVLNMVVTDTAQRGRRLAERACGSLLAWGRRAGAAEACLQVVAANAPGLALYRRLGFATELYRYSYRRKPM